MVSGDGFLNSKVWFKDVGFGGSFVGPFPSWVEFICVSFIAYFGSFGFGYYTTGFGIVTPSLWYAFICVVVSLIVRNLVWFFSLIIEGFDADFVTCGTLAFVFFDIFAYRKSEQARSSEGGASLSG